MMRSALWTGLLGICLLTAVNSRGSAAEVQPAVAPPEQSAPFDVWEFRVLGNSVLPAREVESAVYPFLGAQRTIEVVEQARQALERAYRDKGYGTVFVDIPEQDVVDGVVRLKVTEGKLARVRISGARYFSNGRIRTEVTAL